MRFILPLLFFSNFLFGQNLTPKKYVNLDKWGYEDGSGNNVISPDYFEAQPFEGDFAIVKKTKGYGLINKKGEVIFGCKYAKIKHWKNGIFLMYWKTSSFIHIGLAEDKHILNSTYHHVSFFFENELRAFRQSGSEIISDNAEVGTFGINNDLIWRQKYGLVFQEKYGLIDSSDQLIVPLVYDTIMFSYFFAKENFNNCIAKKDNKWHRIDLSKRPVEIQEYDALEYLKNGKILFRKNNEFGLIEFDGTEMTSPSWEDILSNKRINNNGNLLVLSLCDRFCVFNNNYKPIIPPVYKSLTQIYGTEFFIAQKDKLFGLINIENQVVIDFKYESLTQFMRSGLYALQNGKLGIIDFDGEIIIPFDYEQNNNLTENYSSWDGQYVPLPKGVLRIQKDGKVGIIDIKNNIIIPFEYENIKGLNFQKKYYQAKKNGKWGVLNSKNEWVISPEFDAFSSMVYYNVREGYFNRSYHNKILQNNELQSKWSGGDGFIPRSKNIFLAEKNGKTTAFNLEGKQLFPFQDFNDKINDHAQVFHYKLDTLLLAGSKNGYGLVNQKGKIWLDFVYQDIQLYAWDIFLVSKNNKYGLIHKDGSIIQPIEYQEIKGQKVLKDGKYGILNKNRKSFLFDVTYDAIEIKSNPSGGNPYFLISQNKKWGWSDFDGEEIIPISYDSLVALSVYQKMAKVFVNGKWGIVKVGVEGFVLPAKYEKILMEQEKVKVRENTTWEIIDLENNNTITKDWDEINGRTVRKGKYWGLINEEGKLISEIEYEILLYHQNNTNVHAKKNGKWGVINLENQIILNFKYDEIKFLYNGFIKVRKEKKWGVINYKEEVIVDFEYESIDRLSNDFFRVYKNGRWGIISKNGEIVAKIEYEYIPLFIDEKEILVKENEKVGVINLEGDVILDYTYESISKIENNYLVTKNGKIGIVNSDNEIILPIEYTSLYKRNLFIESYKDWKRGLVNLKGKVILKCKYDEIIYDETCILEGCPIAVRKKGKWGYINLKGKTLIKFQYSYANIFVKDTAPVGDGNGRFLINRKGKKISKYYDRIESGVLKNDLTIVSKGQSKGMINGKGEEVIPVKYKHLWIQRRRQRNINQLGEFRVGLIHAIDFFGKTTVLKNNGDSVFLSQNGPPVFFQKGMASIDKGNNQWLLEDIKGHQLLSEFSHSTHVFDRYFIVSQNQKMGLYDVIKKEFLIKPKYENLFQRWEKENYIIFCRSKNEEKYFLLRDHQLKQIDLFELKPYYDGSEEFYIVYKEYKNGKPILLDKNKKEILIKDFHYGHIYQYHKKEGWLKIYKEGENEKSNKFKTIIKARIGSEMKWITPDGEIFNTKDLKTDETRITKNLIHFEGINNSYSGLKLLNGKITFPETGVADTHMSDGFIFVRDNNYEAGFYFISNHTYKFFGKLKRPFLMDGFPLRWIMENEKYRFINNRGEFVNTLLFDFVALPSEGLIAVEQNEKIGFLNGKGEMQIPFNFESDYSTKNTFKFQEGLAHVLKNGKYGFINTKGETVIPFEYDIAFPAKNGEVVVWKNQEWQLLKVKDFIKK